MPASLPLTAATIQEVQEEMFNTSSHHPYHNTSRTDSTGAQVVPNISFVSNHSYSSQPKSDFQTFGAKSPYSTLERVKNPQPSTPCSTSQNNVSSSYMSESTPDRLDQGFVNESGDVTVIEQTPSVHSRPPLPARQKPPVYNNWKSGHYMSGRPGHHTPGLGQHDSYLTESNVAEHDTASVITDDTESGAVQFSCADISEALHTKTPQHFQRFQILESIPDDETATTTSGSYVVDPQDLCNEIDELFFKDMVV